MEHSFQLAVKTWHVYWAKAWSLCTCGKSHTFHLEWFGYFCSNMPAQMDQNEVRENTFFMSAKRVQKKSLAAVSARHFQGNLLSNMLRQLSSFFPFVVCVYSVHGDVYYRYDPPVEFRQSSVGCFLCQLWRSVSIFPITQLIRVKKKQQQHALCWFFLDGCMSVQKWIMDVCAVRFLCIYFLLSLSKYNWAIITSHWCLALKSNSRKTLFVSHCAAAPGQSYIHSNRWSYLRVLVIIGRDNRQILQRQTVPLDKY